MFAIGQFSRICRVTTKALRHYDEIGLLKPACIDPVTQYRYYAPEQAAAWRRISLFKEPGFGLEAIRELMEQPLDAAALAAAFGRPGLEVATPTGLGAVDPGQDHQGNQLVERWRYPVVRRWRGSAAGIGL